MVQETEKESAGTSRREFLKVAGLATGTAALAAAVSYPLLGCGDEEALEKFPEAKFFVEHDPSICSGCNVCMHVCSLYHFGESSPLLSAITIRTDPLDGYTTDGETCRQCISPTCMVVCPVEGAMYVDGNTGARLIDPEKCIACHKCAEACEFNIDRGRSLTHRQNWVGSPEPQIYKIIKYNPNTKVYFKCDLCDGDPQCVRLCPMGALSIKEVE